MQIETNKEEYIIMSRDRLVNATEMVQKAKAGGYAIGHFNINNLEWTQCILEAAQETNTPIILGVSEGAGKYMGGYQVVYNMVTGLLDSMDITVPVALHLDHGQTYEACEAAINAGFSSVMIDTSHLPIDENIETTKRVVKYAHPRGVSVEAEVGTVGGEEDGVVGDIIYADTNECVRMKEEANIDFLAAALGSVHGNYVGEPVFGFEEMTEISQATGLPLVLHGGSGIPDEQIQEAIRRGHAKINVNTELQQAFTKAVRENLDNDAKVYDPRKVIAPGKEAIIKVTKEIMERFGSLGKADA